MKKLLLTLLIAPLCAFAQEVPADKAPPAEKAGKYQVTGPVAEVSDTKIVVMKGPERFELMRNSDTKVEGDLKAGAKVTIKYVMTAATVEVKGDEKKSAGTAEKTPAKKK